MRELNLSEVSYISGGINCIDAATYDKLKNRAVNEGLAYTALTSLAIGAFGFYSGLLVPAALFAGAVAPYTFMTGYFYSSSFNIFSTP